MLSSFNQTNVELKYCTINYHISFCGTFNQTNVELKYEYNSVQEVWRKLLIRLM